MTYFYSEVQYTLQTWPIFSVSLPEKASKFAGKCFQGCNEYFCYIQVLAFFSARLEQHPDQTLSVGVVLDVIKQGTLQWPRDRLKVNIFAKLRHVVLAVLCIKHFGCLQSKSYRKTHFSFMGLLRDKHT